MFAPFKRVRRQPGLRAGWLVLSAFHMVPSPGAVAGIPADGLVTVAVVLRRARAL